MNFRFVFYILFVLAFSLFACNTETPTDPKDKTQDQVVDKDQTNDHNVQKKTVYCPDEKGTKKQKGAANACYVSNQIITNVSGFNQLDIRQLGLYLTNLNFEQVQVCHCEEELILWEYQGEDIPDLIGVVEGAGTKGKGIGGGSGIGLNYQIELDTLSFNNTLKNTINISPAADNFSDNKVRVGVIDSGVADHDYIRNTFRSTEERFCEFDEDHRKGLNIYYKKEQEQTDLNQGKEPVDDLQHGTLVNGIIAGAAYPDPGKARNVKIEIVNAKVNEPGKSSIDFFSALCGTYYLFDRKVQVINNSWGFTASEIPEPYLPILARAEQEEVLLVAGSGNDSTELSLDQCFWPACFSQKLIDPKIKTTGHKVVISVGALGPNQETISIAAFSNHGKMVDLYAPGSGIVSTSNKDRNAFSECKGTSMATAYVSRTAAIIAAMDPDKSGEEIKQCILNAARVQQTENDRSFKCHEHQGSLRCTSLLGFLF